MQSEVRATAERLAGWLLAGAGEQPADATADVTASVAERLRRRTWSAVRPVPVAPLAQAAAAAALSATDRLRLRPALRVRLDGPSDGDSDLRLVLPDRSLTLAPGAAGAIAVLLAGEPFTVGELPGLTDDQRLGLCRRLLREALVVPSSE